MAVVWQVAVFGCGWGRLFRRHRGQASLLQSERAAIRLARDSSPEAGKLAAFIIQNPPEMHCLPAAVPARP
ncbi:hypothetical protein EMIT0373P_10231 [Pseudomonas chlororaphis]